MQKIEGLVDSILKQTDVEEGDVCIVSISDVHLMNNWSYGRFNSRGVNSDLEEKFFTMKEAIDVASVLKAPFVVTGDLLDQKYVDAITLMFAGEIFAYAQRSEIPNSIWLRGNHECYDSNADFSSLDFLKYFCKPFNKGRGIVCSHPNRYMIETHNKKIFFSCLPANQKIDDHLKIELDYMNGKKFKKEWSMPYDYKIMLLHGAIQGADLGSMRAPQGIPPELIQKASDLYDWVICGDFHKFQYVNEKDNVFYCGSPKQMNSGDIGDKRGYQILNLTKKSLNFIKSKACTFKILEYVPGEYVHPYIKNPKKYTEKIRNKILIIRITGSQEDIVKFDFDSIKKELMLNGAFSVVKDPVPVGEKRNSVRIDKDLSYQKIIQKYVESHDYNLKEKQKVRHIKVLNKYAKEAYYGSKS